MKLSAETLLILKNFASINPNFTINEGSEIKTVSEKGTIYAMAKISEYFDKDFWIYDLSQFLSTLGMFKTPEITFEDNENGRRYCHIVDEEDSTIQTKFWAASPNILTKVRELKQIPESQVTFTMTAVNSERLKKASGIIQCPDLKFKGGEGKIRAIVYDESGANANTFTIDLQDNYEGEDFEVHLKQERLKLIGGDYTYSIIGKKAIFAKNMERDIEYLVILDSDRPRVG